MAAAQLETLNSEAFDMDAATMKAITGLEESAAEHLDQLQAAPVYTAPETKEQKQEDEQEEDFDETLSTEDSMIMISQRCSIMSRMNRTVMYR